jgi:hypothetical protein
MTELLLLERAGFFRAECAKLSAVRTAVVGIGLLAAVVSIGAACSGDDASGDGPSSSSDSGAAARTTSTPVPRPTTTQAPFYEGPELSDVDPMGCDAGSGDGLPEGWWPGEIRAVEATSVDFDVVCFYGGHAGIDAAAADGVEFVGYHVRNPDPRTYRVTFADGTVPASCAGTDISRFACTVADVLPLYPGLDRLAPVGDHETIGYPVVWIHVTGTTPDHLHVQLRPL